MSYGSQLSTGAGSERARGDAWMPAASAGTYALEMSDVIRAAQLGDEYAFGHLVSYYFSAAHALPNIFCPPKKPPPMQSRGSH